MPDIGEGDIAKVAIYQRLYDQRVLNVLYYRVQALGNPVAQSTALQELANEIADETKPNGLVAKMRLALSVDLSFEQVRAQMVYPLPTVYYSSPMGFTASVNKPAGTANVAASITKKTERFGERGIGRMQLGGIPNDGYTGGILTPAQIDLLDEVGNAMRLLVETPAGLITWVPVLYHGPASLVVYDVVTHYEVQHTVRDMRRRTVGLGE